MEEIPNSKTDIKLFRRFPNEEKEMDYGPGYIKLYRRTDAKALVGIHIVFRSHGTMKVRANHLVPALFDTSFENELRYIAQGDLADLTPGSSGVYGKAVITEPQNFPLSFEFESEDERDAFVNLLKQHIESDKKKDQDCHTEAKEEKPGDDQKDTELTNEKPSEEDHKSKASMGLEKAPEA
jgi:hypothetical protein